MFTGVPVSEPPHCKVPGGTFTTNPLQSQLLHDATNHNIVFKRFVPTGSNIATIRTESDGTGTCSVEGNQIPRGAFCGGWENQTGVDAVNQPLTARLATEETIGNVEDSCELILAGNPAHLTGTVNTELTGVNAGKEWGAKGKMN